MKVKPKEGTLVQSKSGRIIYVHGVAGQAAFPTFAGTLVGSLTMNPMHVAGEYGSMWELASVEPYDGEISQNMLEQIQKIDPTFVPKFDFECTCYQAWCVCARPKALKQKPTTLLDKAKVEAAREYNQNLVKIVSDSNEEFNNRLLPKATPDVDSVWKSFVHSSFESDLRKIGHSEKTIDYHMGRLVLTKAEAVIFQAQGNLKKEDKS